MRVPWLRRLLVGSLALGLLGAGVLGVLYLRYVSDPLIEIVHLPETFSRRSGDLSANVSLRLHTGARTIRFRVNHGEWRSADRWHVRTPVPLATIELLPQELRPGVNDFEVEVGARLRPPERSAHTFRYDPTPLELPLEVDWKERELEVQDGYWEKIERDGVWRVRPRPGYEGYDRILLVTGALPVDRRIETDVIFRHTTLAPASRGAREYAFGVLSLWGGHPEDESYFPRRGWSFAMAWWWSKPGGAGNEISYKKGAGRPLWVSSYRDEPLVPDVPYRVVIEVRDVRDDAGRHLSHRQRMQWWRADTSPPEGWLELDDVEGAPLPEGDYGIGLMAFNCQAEFGPLRVVPLP
jgi:hypothetical protein